MHFWCFASGHVVSWLRPAVHTLGPYVSAGVCRAITAVHTWFEHVISCSQLCMCCNLPTVGSLIPFNCTHVIGLWSLSLVLPRPARNLTHAPLCWAWREEPQWSLVVFCAPSIAICLCTSIGRLIHIFLTRCVPRRSKGLLCVSSDWQVCVRRQFLSDEIM